MSGSRVRLGNLDRLRVSAMPHPGATLYSLLCDVLGGRPQGVPPKMRARLRAAVPESAARLLSPLFVPGISNVPDGLAPTRLLPDEGVDRQLERIRDLPREAVRDEVVDAFRQEGGVPRRWEPVWYSPDRYATAFAQAYEALWGVYEPIWRRSRLRRDKEVERVGVAAVTGTMEVVLSGLNAHWRLSGTDLHYVSGKIGDHDLGERRLVLVPMVSGANASALALKEPDPVWIGYPVRGLWDQEQPLHGPGDALSAVVGEVRATILRQCARRPTMGDVATRLTCAPATVTYHCQQLEDAGLLTREKRGRQVRLRLTDRGQALLDLLA